MYRCDCLCSQQIDLSCPRCSLPTTHQLLSIYELWVDVFLLDPVRSDVCRARKDLLQTLLVMGNMLAQVPRRTAACSPGCVGRVLNCFAMRAGSDAVGPHVSDSVFVLHGQ